MRKRNIAALLLTGLTGCAQRGDTSGVEIVVGTSERFSDEDIRGAMDAAMRAFHRGHSGCALVRLAYNEAYQTCWLAGAGAGDAVSYTHLDVYKRQAVPSTPEPMMQRSFGKTLKRLSSLPRPLMRETATVVSPTTGMESWMACSSWVALVM